MHDYIPGQSDHIAYFYRYAGGQSFVAPIVMVPVGSLVALVEVEVVDDSSLVDWTDIYNRSDNNDHHDNNGNHNADHHNDHGFYCDFYTDRGFCYDLDTSYQKPFGPYPSSCQHYDCDPGHIDLRDYPNRVGGLTIHRNIHSH